MIKLEQLATRDVIRVRPDDSLDKAICLMEEYGIHHLLVEAAGRLVGVISDRDLLLCVGWMLSIERKIAGSRKGIAGPRTVMEIMSPRVHALPPDASLRDAARLMVEEHIGAVPLVNDDALCGIVTRFDLLSRFCRMVDVSPPMSPLRQLIGEHMRANVHTVQPRDPIHAALTLMREKHLRHLPVVAEDLVIGMVTDRDIRKAFGLAIVNDERAQETGEFYIGPTQVAEIMTKPVYTTTSIAPLVDAAREMLKRRIGALPVVRDDSLVGIIADTDIMRIVGQTDA